MTKAYRQLHSSHKSRQSPFHNDVAMSSSGRRYMSKRNRACDSCRARKAACRIDSTPPCYLCTLHRKECTFVHPTNRPRQFENVPSPGQGQGFTPAVYDSALLDNLMPTGQDALDVDAPGPSPSLSLFFQEHDPSLSHGFGDGIWPTGFTPREFTCSSLGVPASPLRGEASPVTQESLLDAPLDLEYTMTPQLLGSSGDMDPFILRQYQYDSSGKFHFKSLGIQSVAVNGHPTQFLLSPPSLYTTGRKETGSSLLPSPHIQRQQLEAIVPPDIGHRLISLLQRIVLPQYPIFSSTTQLNPNTSPPSLLASVYLISESFIKFDERLCIDLAYEKPSGKALYKIINDAISYEIHAPTIATIQALFLLVIRPYINPIVQDSGLKWTQFSTLVACAHSLGLHLDPKPWKIPPWQISLRRRLSYLIYMGDKWLALSLGRPSLIHPESWLVTSLDAGDRLDSGHNSLTWAATMKQMDLERILEQVLLKLYTPRALHILSSQYEKGLDISQALLKSLESWRQGVLMQSDDLTPSGQGGTIGPGRISEMSYHYIHLAIIRAAMRPFTQSSSDQPDSTGFLSAQQQVRTQAKACVTTAASFIRSLGSNDLEMLWPAWTVTGFSSICFQILLMATSSPNTEEAIFWVNCLQQVRRDMRLKADTLQCLCLGLLRIDSIFWKGIDNVLSLEEHVRQAFQESTKVGFFGTANSATDWR